MDETVTALRLPARSIRKLLLFIYYYYSQRRHGG